MPKMLQSAEHRRTHTTSNEWPNSMLVSPWCNDRGVPQFNAEHHVGHCQIVEDGCNINIILAKVLHLDIDGAFEKIFWPCRSPRGYRRLRRGSPTPSLQQSDPAHSAAQISSGLVRRRLWSSRCHRAFRRLGRGCAWHAKSVAIRWPSGYAHHF